MEPKPVESTKTPSYPTRREVLAGGAAFMLATLGGQWRVFAETKEGKIVVAPLFEHGKGRGATGCVVTSPPVFLSEEEAMQIIREELDKHGIHLKNGKAMKDVEIPTRYVDHKVNKGKREEEITVAKTICKPLQPSGVASDKKVVVQFVCVEHYDDLGGPGSPPGTGSSVQHYNFKETAEYVAGEVKRQEREKMYFGVFYDPAVRIDWKALQKKDKKADFNAVWRKAEDASKQEAKKLLREQVQDFAAWLKEQKVIQ
jgi:hypothetical protein